MNKQKPLALLMATIAIFMLAIACGSSDNTTTTPNQGVTSQPATETTRQPAQDHTKATQTQQPTAPSTPTAEAPATTPWPSPLPTRTIPPTPRNPVQQTATAAAPPPTQPPQTPQTQETPAPQTEVLPEYDGSSPLIHVYVEEPFLLFRGGVGATIKIPLKGLTQDGQHVNITDPARWGITFEDSSHDQKKPYKFSEVDQDGKYTVLKYRGKDPAIGGRVQINLPNTYFRVFLIHPETEEALQYVPASSPPRPGGTNPILLGRITLHSPSLLKDGPQLFLHRVQSTRSPRNSRRQTQKRRPDPPKIRGPSTANRSNPQRSLPRRRND